MDSRHQAGPRESLAFYQTTIKMYDQTLVTDIFFHEKIYVE